MAVVATNNKATAYLGTRRLKVYVATHLLLEFAVRRFFEVNPNINYDRSRLNPLCLYKLGNSCRMSPNESLCGMA